jgi:Zn-dependent alcohol dehydrogenase
LSFRFVFHGSYPHPLPAVSVTKSAGVVEQVGIDVTYVKPGVS